VLFGILSDIHDAIAPLNNALAKFREAGVEQVVTLGDAFETFRRGEAGGDVARILRDAGAVGVWGNHDIGLSHEVSDEIRNEAEPDLLEFASRLEPHLVLENCRFSHIEPWRDPTSIPDLWHIGEMSDLLSRAPRCFSAVPEAFLFMGHYHRWLIAGSDGTVIPEVERPLLLTSAARYLVVTGAVKHGWCATFDSITAELTPIRCPTNP